MAKVKVPQNVGKVRIAIGLGNKITVWNGKQGQHEFVIICRNMDHAKELCTLINSKKHGGEVDVHG